MRVARYNKSKYSTASTSSSSSAGGGGGTVVPMPVDLTDIYNRLATLEQKVNSINLDNYLSKTKNDETPYTISAGTIATNDIHGKQWYSDNQGYRIYDGTENSGQPTFNLKQTEHEDSQTVAPFPTDQEYYTWYGLEYNKPKSFTLTASTTVSNLNMTHEDAELDFYIEFLCTDRRVTVQSRTVEYTVDSGTTETLTPDEDGLCSMPLTTGTHTYDITVTYEVIVLMQTGQSIPSSAGVEIYGTDRDNEQTEVWWVNSTINKHTRITPSEVTVLKNLVDGYSLHYDGLYKIIGGVAHKQPEKIWEATGTTGLTALETDLSNNISWQLTGLDMSNYKRVKIYSKAAQGSTVASGASTTAAMVLEMHLDTKATGPYGGIYVGSVVSQKPNDRNRLATLTCAVSADKTSFAVMRMTNLYGTAASNNSDVGGYVYRIEGYFD